MPEDDERIHVDSFKGLDGLLAGSTPLSASDDFTIGEQELKAEHLHVIPPFGIRG